MHASKGVEKVILERAGAADVVQALGFRLQAFMLRGVRLGSKRRDAEGSGFGLWAYFASLLLLHLASLLKLFWPLYNRYQFSTRCTDRLRAVVRNLY